MAVLVPEWIGCGNKLELFECLDLHSAVGGDTNGSFPDANVIRVGGREFVTSIDKLFHIEIDSASFAKLALRHAIADICVMGAQCISVDVSFEFGAKTSKTDREELTVAIYDAAKRMGIKIGKCHSTFSSTTAVTISAFGQRLSTPVKERNSESGTVILSGRLGLLGILYCAALSGDYSDAMRLIDSVSAVDHRAMAEICAEFSDCTDVSGFGLWGSAITVAKRYNRSLTINLGSESSYIMDGLMKPECLVANIRSDLVEGVSPLVEYEAIRREFCGPYLFLVPDDFVQEILTKLREAGWTSPQKIGRYVIESEAAVRINV